MMKKYIQPDIGFISVGSSEDILAMSTDEVFVDGGDLFDE